MKSLYDRWTTEVVAQQHQPAQAARNIMSESARLRALAAALGYTPPAKRALPARLERSRLSFMEGPARAAEAALRYDARRNELRGQLGEVEAELAALSFDAEPDYADRLLRRRAALGHLIGLVPESPRTSVDSSLASSSSAEAEEVNRLLAWLDALEGERKRIQVEVGDLERSGVVALSWHPLRQDLADVMQARLEARENLKLAGAPRPVPPGPPPPLASPDAVKSAPAFSLGLPPRPLGKF